jgi:hypothetical protein
MVRTTVWAQRAAELIAVALLITAFVFVGAPVWHGRHQRSQDSQAEQILVVADHEANKLALDGRYPDKLTLAQDLDNEEPEFGSIGTGYSLADVTGADHLFILSTSGHQLVLAVRSASGRLCQLVDSFHRGAQSRGCSVHGSVYSSQTSPISDRFTPSNFGTDHGSGLGRWWLQLGAGLAPAGTTATIFRSDLNWGDTTTTTDFILSGQGQARIRVGAVVDHQPSGQSLAVVWQTATGQLTIGVWRDDGTMTGVKTVAVPFALPGQYQLSLTQIHGHLHAALSNNDLTQPLAQLTTTVPAWVGFDSGNPGVILGGPRVPRDLIINSAAYQPLP